MNILLANASEAAIEPALVLVILATLGMLGSSRIIFCIRLVAVQGIAISLLPLMLPGNSQAHAWLFAIGTLAVKGLALPLFLLYARRRADVPREVDPYVGFAASTLAGVALLAVSFWIASRLPLPLTPPSPLLVPVSFFCLFAGLLIIVSRRKALTQVLGYLVMENGIYSFGMTVAPHRPLLVEAGVLLDLIVGVLVMGIAILHISREFDHIDVDQMNLLHDAARGEDAES